MRANPVAPSVQLDSAVRSPLNTNADARIASCAVPGDGGGLGGGPATGFSGTELAAGAGAGAGGLWLRSTWTAGWWKFPSGMRMGAGTGPTRREGLSFLGSEP